MKLRLISLTAGAGRMVEATFGIAGSDETVFDKFRLAERHGRLAVTGSERDVLNWCDGSAEDVRRVIRAVVAFAEAYDPGRSRTSSRCEPMRSPS
jgi:hypothetical protein